MKKMFLMSLVLSVMAVGSAMANDNSVDRGPKKRVVVVVNPGNMGPDFMCGDCHRHDFDRPKPRKGDCRPGKGCDWKKRPNCDKHPKPGAHDNNRPPKPPKGPEKGHKPGRK